MTRDEVDRAMGRSVAFATRPGASRWTRTRVARVDEARAMGKISIVHRAPGAAPRRRARDGRRRFVSMVTWCGVHDRLFAHTKTLHHDPSRHPSPRLRDAATGARWASAACGPCSNPRGFARTRARFEVDAWRSTRAFGSINSSTRRRPTTPPRRPLVGSSDASRGCSITESRPCSSSTAPCRG